MNVTTLCEKFTKARFLKIQIRYYSMVLFRWFQTRVILVSYPGGNFGCHSLGQRGATGIQRVVARVTAKHPTIHGTASPTPTKHVNSAHVENPCFV